MGVPQPRMHSEPPPVAGARWIPLTRGMFALVDEADFAWLNQWNWCAKEGWNTFYAKRKDGAGRIVDMHRVIAGLVAAERSLKTDHRNGNGLDNRRRNLRTCTNAENGQNQRKHCDNTSGFKGVSFDKSRCLWAARVRVAGVDRHLGRFATAIAAARAYDAAAARFHGSVAKLNFGGPS